MSFLQTESDSPPPLLHPFTIIPSLCSGWTQISLNIHSCDLYYLQVHRSVFKLRTTHSWLKCEYHRLSCCWVSTTQCLDKWRSLPLAREAWQLHNATVGRRPGSPSTKMDLSEKLILSSDCGSQTRLRIFMENIRDLVSIWAKKSLELCGYYTNLLFHVQHYQCHLLCHMTAPFSPILIDKLPTPGFWGLWKYRRFKDPPGFSASAEPSQASHQETWRSLPAALLENAPQLSDVPLPFPSTLTVKLSASWEKLPWSWEKVSVPWSLSF